MEWAKWESARNAVEKQYCSIRLIIQIPKARNNIDAAESAYLQMIPADI
jgi:hypothetical protein